MLDYLVLAGAVFGVKTISRAVVLTVWEPVAMWEPYDPGAILGAGIGKLASHALGVAAEGRTARGKSWRTICDVAEELDAATIVVGARPRSPRRTG
jgi:nucleotide-binding universal stress UspA family protein